MTIKVFRTQEGEYCPKPDSEIEDNLTITIERFSAVPASRHLPSCPEAWIVSVAAKKTPNEPMYTVAYDRDPLVS